MGNSFTVELFDVLIYLIPGFIFLAGCYLLFTGTAPTSTTQTDKQFVLIYALLSSFFLGVVIHVLSEAAYIAYEKVEGSFVRKVVPTFEDIGKVREILSNKYQVRLTDDVFIYQYAESIAFEKSGKQSASISRLTALSIFCRNSVLPMLLLGFGLLRLVKEKSRLFWLMWGIAIIVIEAVLIRGMFKYWAAAIRIALQTVITAHIKG